MIVDTGMPGSGRKIVEYVRSLGSDPSEIDYILLTHPDIDHSGGVAELKEEGAMNAKVAIHDADAPRLAGEKKLKEVRGAAGVVVGVFSGLMHFRPVRPDVILKDGMEIGGMVVIHTPGHTEGSVCFHDSANRALFVGDAMMTSSDGGAKLPPKSMTVDMNKAKESVRRLLSLDFDLLLAGHGAPITKGGSKKVAELSSKEM